MTSQSPSTSTLTTLRAKALQAVVGRLEGFDPFIWHREIVRSILAGIEYLQVNLAAEEPPVGLVAALRSPEGRQFLVHLNPRGRPARVVINAVGYPDPVREQEIWDQIRGLTTHKVAA